VHLELTFEGCCLDDSDGRIVGKVPNWQLMEGQKG